jgi:hypothetical protein
MAWMYTAVRGQAFTGLEWEVRVWILAMAAIVAVTDEDDFWILPLLGEELKDRKEFRTWNKLRGVLKRFLWIDVLHDKEGKRVLGKVLACEQLT